jgi:putative hemolysin
MQFIPSLAPYAEKVALTLTVVIITYLFLIAGELALKRLALNFPERIAAWIALPIYVLFLAALSSVKLLSLSTELVLLLPRIKPKNEPTITQEEIKLVLAQRTKEGVFEEAEHRFMENILRLDDIN